MENKLKHLTRQELVELLIEIQNECEAEIWEYHEFSDNFGMTPEQENKVSQMMTDVHNTPYKEITKTINNYLSSKEIV